MPELPEVEVTRKTIEPLVRGKVVERVIIRNSSLRWPVPEDLAKELPGKTIEKVERRGKYLLLTSSAGTVIVHLGMTGNLRIVHADSPPGKHDHVDMRLTDGLCLRYTDQRRFGSIHWEKGDPLSHPLLKRLGPEPLTREFTGGYLFRRSRDRKSSVKAFIMDGPVVTGVGNIYAAEALYRAGINPAIEAGTVSLNRYRSLAGAVKEVLVAAIERGSALYFDSAIKETEAIYFPLKIEVYDRGGQPCRRCGSPIRHIRQHNRSSWFCPKCQR